MCIVREEEGEGETERGERKRERVLGGGGIEENVLKECLLSSSYPS